MEKYKPEIIKLYREGKGAPEIAEQFKTYPNKILRCLKKWGEPIRSNAEAQKLAMESGRLPHPTKGKKRSEETRLKSGEAIRKNWQEKSEEDLEKLKEKRREYWEDKTDDFKEDNLKKMARARLKAAQEGSKLEKETVKELGKLGISCQHHSNVFGGVELDLFLPEYAIGVEIDGITHYEPVFGEEKLVKTQEADHVKNAYVTNAGAMMVRVKNTKRYAKGDSVRLAAYLYSLCESERKAEIIHVDMEKI